MDNVDGKQARRTENSSPLGLLFDHGCDSLTTAFLALSVGGLLQLGRTWMFGLFGFSLLNGFYFATLEQYYTGKLLLPIVNGPSDGPVIIIAIFIASGIYGQDIIFIVDRPWNLVVCTIWICYTWPGSARPYYLGKHSNIYWKVRKT